MTNTICRKTISVLLSFVMMLGVFGALAFSASADTSVSGSWSGSSTAANGTVYSMALELSESGSYTLVTSYKMGETTYKETENGTYNVTGTDISFTGDKIVVEAMENTFDAGNTSGKLNGAEMTLIRHASYMAKTMGKDPVEIVFTKGSSSGSPVYGDTLVSGTYELTADSYDPSAEMKMAADIVVDADAKTFELWRTTMSGEYSKRSEGTISFDETTGVYTINFTTPADRSTTFKFDLISSGITFTSPLFFGAVAMNVTDDNGNFLPYTAYPKAEPFEDTLVSDTYELTADSYDPSAGMKMAADIIINAEAKTFELWRTTMSGEYSKRSEGAISFDETTGVYTVNFTTPADKATTFTYDAETKGVTFTSPLFFGAVAMNVTDDNGNFLPYTAYPKAEPFEDTLVSDTYELTADSYDPSAGMKMAADIIIDAEAKSFELWRTTMSGEYSKRSEGTISFDETTGVYTINFTTPADKATTFTYDAETKGVTFTSPLFFGTVAMNVTDDNGNFLPYTAYPKADEKQDDNTPSAQNYVFTDGVDGTVDQGAASEYRLCCSGPLDKFAALYIDGNLVDESNYTKSEGSTVITLSADYMKTLSVGRHTVKAEYADGSAETTLTVRAVSGEEVPNPQTGDDSNIVLWIALMIVSFVSTALIMINGKRTCAK